MIWYSSPWRDDKNIGEYYNDFMGLIKDDDYACFIDGDSCFTTYFYGKQINHIINKYPECSLFFTMTNRVACGLQVVPGIQHNNDNIVYHRQIGQQLSETKYDIITDVSAIDKNHALSGVCVVIKKPLWQKVNGFNTFGCLDVDNDFFWKVQNIKDKIYLMQGVYLYHWHRGGLNTPPIHLR